MISGWKQRGPILVSALHEFVTYLLAYLLKHLPTYLQPWTHTALMYCINVALLLLYLQFSFCYAPEFHDFPGCHTIFP